MPIHHKVHATLLRRSKHAAAFLQRCRQRFFDEDVHVTRGSFDHDIGVGIVGCGDGDRIQAFVQQVIQLGERLGYCKLPSSSLGTRFVRIAYADQVHRRMLQVGANVHLSPNAATNHSHPNTSCFHRPMPFMIERTLSMIFNVTAISSSVCEEDRYHRPFSVGKIWIP